MKEKFPQSCKVVVIGGGVVGCSVAYHLAKFGWKDTILLERDQLTSGTTWHAAGLVSQLGPTAAITKMRKYTLDLYRELEKKVENKIIIPTIQGMREEGHPYKGFLYIGIMIVNGDPYVIEYNARLGDPESQVLMPMLKDGLFPIVKSVLNKTVKNLNINKKDGYVVTVVLASKGYPEEYKKNMLIEGLDNSFLVFHSGTSIIDNRIHAIGGRVLNVIGYDLSLEGAISNAYKNIKKVNFDNMYYRTDIGKKGLDYLKGVSNE